VWGMEGRGGWDLIKMFGGKEQTLTKIRFMGDPKTEGNIIGNWPWENFSDRILVPVCRGGRGRTSPGKGEHVWKCSRHIRGKGGGSIFPNTPLTIVQKDHKRCILKGPSGLKVSEVTSFSELGDCF